ncbi:MAG: YbhB/YbcL family Raf kinase inhibitor-like protein [Cyanobacteria bacterium P01_H01_bin.121]
MKLSSSAFQHNERIPAQYSCEGDNLSPPLSWEDTPPDTVSFVMIMDDPDAESVIGKTFDHWVLYGIPAQINHLPAGLPQEAVCELGGTQILHGLTTRENYGYRGPCPPPGHGDHHYIFQLYALDFQPQLPHGLTKADVHAVIADHVLAKAELVGIFSR